MAVLLNLTMPLGKTSPWRIQHISALEDIRWSNGHAAYERSGNVDILMDKNIHGCKMPCDSITSKNGLYKIKPISFDCRNASAHLNPLGRISIYGHTVTRATIIVYLLLLGNSVHNQMVHMEYILLIGSLIISFIEMSLEIWSATSGKTNELNWRPNWIFETFVSSFSNYFHTFNCAWWIPLERSHTISLSAYRCLSLREKLFSQAVGTSRPPCISDVLWRRHWHLH